MRIGWGKSDGGLRVQSRLPCIPAEATSSLQWLRPPLLLLLVCQLVQSLPSVYRARRNKKSREYGACVDLSESRGRVRFTAVWRRVLAGFFFPGEQRTKELFSRDEILGSLDAQGAAGEHLPLCTSPLYTTSSTSVSSPIQILPWSIFKVFRVVF